MTAPTKPLTPEDQEIQRRLTEAFGGWRPPPLVPPPVETPRPDQLSDEEVQRRLTEAFGGSRPLLSLSKGGPSPRAVRSLERTLRRPRRVDQGSRVRPAGLLSLSKGRRCDAWIKNPIRTAMNGVRVARSLRCRAWAMESGRCRVHGGSSSGPRTPEGKALSVAAKQAGRREWIARVRSRGGALPFGRKKGEAWVTEPMRERARAEARRLGFSRFTLDRALTLALLGSANGDRAREAKAKAMLDARELAAMELDRQAALARIDNLRASLLANP